jgi:hypothetical protein
VGQIPQINVLVLRHSQPANGAGVSAIAKVSGQVWITVSASDNVAVAQVAT